MLIKIKFVCSECGNQSWTKFNNDTYVLKAADLVCDDCLPDEEAE